MKRVVGKNGARAAVFCLIMAMIASLALTAGLPKVGRTAFGEKIPTMEKTIYGNDFESFGTDATADAIYQATGLAGATRSISDEAGSVYLEANYVFHDNGAQNGNAYIVTNSGGAEAFGVTDAAKTYELSMKYQHFGPIMNSVFAVQAATDNSAGNSVITMNEDAEHTVVVSNYTVADFITKNSASYADGWYDINVTVKGMGQALILIFYMNVAAADVTEANVAGTSGLRIQELSIKETGAASAAYDLGAKLESNPGLSFTGEGYDVIWGATGFAGVHSRILSSGGIIEGKSLSAMFGFHSTESGGWQNDALYVNKAFTPVLKTETNYYLNFDIRMVGRWDSAYFLLEHDFGSGNKAAANILLRSAGTYEMANNGTGEYETFKFIESSSITYLNNGLFNVSLLLNGHGENLFFHMQMHSTDADGANLAGDTGVYFDNLWVKEIVRLDGEYDNKYAQDFNRIEAGTTNAGVYGATSFAAKWADVTLSVENSDINNDNALKAVYSFHEDGGWQVSGAYLNSSVTSTTAGIAYKFSMKVKPFGHWSHLYMGFEPTVGTKAFVVLKSDGTAAVEENTGIILDMDYSYSGGVFVVDTYVLGAAGSNGGEGHIFNFYNMLSTAPATANANKDTGYYIDDYSFAMMRQPQAEGFTKTAYILNKADNSGFTDALNVQGITGVTLGENALTEDADYTYDSGVFTVKAAVFNSLTDGDYDLTVEYGSNKSATVAVTVQNIPMGVDMQTDFAGMPDLNGGPDGNEVFFQNGFMDPGTHDIYTVDAGGSYGRAVRFVSKNRPSESEEQFFQTNPNDGRCNVLTEGLWHSVSINIKPTNASALKISIKTIAPVKDIANISLNLISGLRTDGGSDIGDVSWDAVALGDGWYRVKVLFKYEGGDYTEASRAYVVFSGVSSEADSEYTIDNVVVKSELVPNATTGSNGEYDTATNSAPFYLFELYEFSVTEVKLGATVVATSDYTISTTPNGNKRLTLSSDFCKNNTQDATLYVTTSKGNTLEFSYTVIDSTPVFATAVLSYDKTEDEHVKFDVDLKGKTVAAVKLGTTTLQGVEYYIEEGTGKFIVKYSYLKTLGIGDNVFTLVSSSGATANFTVTIADSSPAFGTPAAFVLGSSADYTVALDIKGKTIQKVQFNNSVLKATEYTYADGTLTVKAAVLNALVAGTYELTVTTVVSSTVTVTVQGNAPVFESGSYSVNADKDFVITVDLKGNTILKVEIAGLALTTEEYSYADGKLTVKKAVWEELSVGTQTLKIQTEGGESEISFELKAASGKSKKGGCGGFAASGSSVLFGGLFLAVGCILKRRRRAK